MPPQDPGSAAGPPGGGWRRKPKTSATRRPASMPPGGGWSKRPDHQPQRAAWVHRLKVSFWALLLLALVGGFVVWLIWTPTMTPFLVAAVTDYDRPLPPNAWATEDLQRLRDLDAKEVLQYSEFSWDSKQSGLDRLRDQLYAARPGGPGKDLVIIYLSMHGVVDGRGEPCLAPPGASASDTGQWLPVRELLDGLFPAARRGALPRHVLLILDANRMDVNWSLGLLYNSFADALKDLIAQADIPNLTVLNSAGPGQIGYAAPELKDSVFAYFLWQGLRGAADVEKTGNQDGKVSLQELYAYLHDFVGGWVIENRGGDIQQPMLLTPKGDPTADYPLVYRQSSQGTSLPERPQQIDPRWDEIARLWQASAALGDAPWRSDPLGWAETQRKLLRLEQLVQAGAAYQREFTDLGEEVNAQIERMRAGDLPPGELAAHSLPLARRFGLLPADVSPESLPGPWRKPPEKTEPPQPASEPPTSTQSSTTTATAAAGPDKPATPAAPPPAAASPAAQSPAVQPPAAPPAVEPPYDYLAAASAACDWLDKDFSHDHVSQALAFIDRAQRRPGVDLIEVHFLRMMDRYLDAPVWTSAAEQVQTAMAVRNAAEQAASPADPRVQYWLRAAVDAADERRRADEDLLFIGGAGPTTAVPVDRQTATAGYSAAVAQADQVAAAFALRDRAWAEIPFLADWLLARLHPADAAQLDQLQSVIRGADALGQELDDLLATGQWPEDAQAKTADLKKQLDAMRDGFLRECTDLEQAGPDKQTLGAIANLLAVPLVPADQRNDLRGVYLRRLTSPAQGFRIASAEETGAKSATAETGQAAWQFLVRLNHAKQHPALTILRLATRQGPADENQSPVEAGSQEDSRPEEYSEVAYRQRWIELAGQGDEVRRLLSGVGPQAETHLAETLAKLASGEKSPAAVRAGRSAADRLVRASAAWLAQSPWARPATDPAHLLRNLDLHYLLLWQARRTLDDFWGPSPGSPTPFFDTAATDYLRSAESLCKNDAALQDARNLLALGREAAAEAIQPGPLGVLFVDAKETATAQHVPIAEAAHLPAGRAAFYLQDRQGELLPLLSAKTAASPDVRRIGCAVNPAGGNLALDYWIPNDKRLQDAATLEAIALYRGHVRTRSFDVQPAEGLDIVYQRPQYPPPTITVHGGARQSGSVEFILDCSASMGTPLARDRTTTRMKVARDTLLTILRRLADPDSAYRVGLRVYGHRVGMNPDRSGTLVIRDPKNPAHFLPRPPELAQIVPSNDVELLLKPGQFTLDDYNAISDRVQSLRDLGETPLYLSVIEAIGDLSAETDVSQRRVVVITDGFNYQSGGGEDIRTRGDVEKALQSHPGVHLDIVGFTLTASDADERQSLDDLKALATGSGGAFHSADDPTSLLDALEKALGLSKYVVETADGRSLTPQPLDLNTTCNQITRPGRYRVALVDPQRPAETEVDVEGGEAIELWVDEDPSRQPPRRLVYHRYDKSLRAFHDQTPAPSDPQQRSFFIGTHVPQREGNAVKFFLSVQNAVAEEFSPRPAEVWAQIKPVVPAGHPGSDTIYSFYDAVYEPDYPVPMLSFTAPNWPAEAATALVRFCGKLQKTPPDVKVSVADFPREKARIDRRLGGEFTLETEPPPKPGDPYRVIFTEKQPADRGIYALKVEMLPAAAKTIHHYSPKTGTVRHTFLYPDATAADVAASKLLLTTSEKLVEGAIALPDPLEVTLTPD